MTSPETPLYRSNLDNGVMVDLSKCEGSQGKILSTGITDDADGKAYIAGFHERMQECIANPEACAGKGSKKGSLMSADTAAYENKLPPMERGKADASRYSCSFGVK